MALLGGAGIAIGAGVAAGLGASTVWTAFRVGDAGADTAEGLLGTVETVGDALIWAAGGALVLIFADRAFDRIRDG